MRVSLSALLPVRNVQSTVEATIAEILEVLPELTDRFELVVVDDCSTDATAEVLPELAACYPQIRLVQHTSRWGRAEAIRTGLAHSTGGVLFLRDENCTLAIDEVHKLWDSVLRHQIVIGCPEAAGRTAWRFRKSLPARMGGNYQFVQRTTLEQLQGSLRDDGNFREILAGLDLRWREVEVRDRGRDAWEPPAARQRQPAPARADLSQQPPGRPRRPNYLKRLRDFALGE